MSSKPRILFLAGSIRAESFNRRLGRLACGMAEQGGAEAAWLDLADYPMPLYNGDLEQDQGVPDSALALKREFRAADGFFIAAPEYNSSVTPLLKNTLDWISRQSEPDEPPLSAYRGKVAGLASASPGGLGGLRGLVVLRMMLGNIGVHVVPSQLAVPGAAQAFDDEGRLADSGKSKALEGVVSELIDTATRIKGG